MINKILNNPKTSAIVATLLIVILGGLGIYNNWETLPEEQPLGAISAPSSVDGSLVGYWTMNEDDLTEGEDLITNGTFDSDTWWSHEAGVTIADNVCHFTSVDVNYTLFRANLIEIGKEYVVKFDILNHSSGGVKVYFGSNASATYSANETNITVSGTVTGNPTFYIASSENGTTLDIDNVVVKEIDSSIKDKSGNGNNGAITRTDLITNGDFASGTGWTFETGWALGTNEAVATAANATAVRQNDFLVQGREYRLTYTMTRSAGSVRPYWGDYGTTRSTSGTYVETFTGTSNDDLQFVGTTFTGTVTDVKIEDITYEQDQNGVPNQAMPFDGVGDKLTLTNSITQSTGTYSVWIKTSDVTTEANLILNNDAYSRVYFVNGALLLETDTNGETFNTANDAIVVDEWNHIVVSRDGDTTSFYNNGVFISNETIASADDLTVSSIGGKTSIRWFNGDMSDVAIYSSALTQDEVSQLYLAGRTTAKISMDASDLFGIGAIGNWTNPSEKVLVAAAPIAQYSRCYFTDYLKEGHTYRVNYTVNSISGGTFALAWIHPGATFKTVSSTGSGSVTTTCLSDSYSMSIYNNTADSNINITIDSVIDITNAITPKLQKGLILDMPLAEPYTEAGSDLIYGAWAVNNGWADTGGGSFTYTSDVSNSYLSNTNNLELGKVYQLQYEITSNDNSTVLEAHTTNFFTLDPIASTVGTHSYIYTAVNSDDIIIRVDASEPSGLVIDNITIKELDGTTKDRTPYGNDGTVSGATIKYDGLVNGGDGIAYINQDKAYGTWEFYFNKVGASDDVWIKFISNENGGTNEGQGYHLLISSAEEILLRENNDNNSWLGFYASAGYISINTDYRIKITRDLSGVFTGYIKGGEYGWDDWTTIVSAGGGSNPTAARNTYTTSSYLVVDLDSGDTVSNLKINGKRHSLASATQSTGTWTTTGPAYDFDGTDDYIDLGADKPTVLTGDITISAWINPSGWGEEGFGRILDNGELYCYTRKYDDRIQFTSVTGGASYSADNSVSLDIWQHILITRKNNGDTTSDTNIYINGVLSGDANQDSGEPTPGDTNTFIGNNDAGDRTFDGQISGVKIWNRILSASEIDYLYSKERNKY